MKNSTLYILVVCLLAFTLATQAAPINDFGDRAPQWDGLMKNFTSIEQSFTGKSYGCESSNILTILAFLFKINIYYHWDKFCWTDFCDEGYEIGCNEYHHECPPAVPEPASVALCGMVILGFASYRLRAMRK